MIKRKPTNAGMAYTNMEDQLIAQNIMLQLILQKMDLKKHQKMTLPVETGNRIE